jgi:NADPH-dependent ferric siderophore reductase
MSEHQIFDRATPRLAIPRGPRHHVLKVRRETRRRLVTVAATERITPKMLRIRFTSRDLHDFESLAPDDHVKLFVPNPAGGDPCKRDYTPRTFDATRGTLAIDFALHEAGDFALHEAGPATAWALAAQPGDDIEIGGPRGSMIVADDFDWYLLIGDETALPAIGRRVESLRTDVPVRTITLVSNDAERQNFSTRADWEAIWVSRAGHQADDATLLLAALEAAGPLPKGDGYVWIAAEARVARALRSYMSETLGQPAEWLKASGYWTIGEADAHITIEN